MAGRCGAAGGPGSLALLLHSAGSDSLLELRGSNSPSAWASRTGSIARTRRAAWPAVAGIALELGRDQTVGGDSTRPESLPARRVGSVHESTALFEIPMFRAVCDADTPAARIRAASARTAGS